MPDILLEKMGLDCYDSKPWRSLHFCWWPVLKSLSTVWRQGRTAVPFTEWLGVQAIFGAFLAGVAIGHSSHLRERIRTTID